MSRQLLVIRVLVLVALSVSAAQFADFLTEAGAFCSFDGDCEAVTGSAFGRPLGIPLPAVGVFGFGFLFVLTLLPNSRAFRLARPFGTIAGSVAIALLVVQFAVLGRICPLCIVVDVCSVSLAVAVLVRRPEATPPVRLRLVGWIVAGLAAVIVPLATSLSELPPPVPEQVKTHWQPGRVTLVEVTDFDCPACKQADVVLMEVLSHHDVQLVRLVAVMPKHVNARPAGRAYVAARRQGKGEEMVAALFAADVRNPARCRELAARLGLNLIEYDRAVDDGTAEVEFNATTSWARD